MGSYYIWNFESLPLQYFEDDGTIVPYIAKGRESRTNLLNVIGGPFTYQQVNHTSTTVMAKANTSLLVEYGEVITSSSSGGSRISGAVHLAGPAILLVVKSDCPMTKVSP